METAQFYFKAMIDFAQYWADVRLEVLSGDRDWDRMPRQQTVQANGGVWRLDWIRHSSADDSLMWGWWAYPIDRAPNGACMLWLPGYSYGTPPADSTCLIPGVCTFCLNVHGKMPDEPYVNPAGREDYILQGIDTPVSYIYRRISLACLAAVDVALAQPETNVDRLVVGGMSQGGGLAIIVAANSNAPALCFADMPFLSDVRETLKTSSSPIYKSVRNFHGHDGKRAQAISDVLSLFDPLNHAPNVHIPTWMSVGGRDPSVKRSAVERVFNALGSHIKHLEFFEAAGHEFRPEMNLVHTQWINEMVINSKVA